MITSFKEFLIREEYSNTEIWEHVLFHGTSSKNAANILKNGFREGDNKYHAVSLTVDPEQALDYTGYDNNDIPDWNGVIAVVNDGHLTNMGINGVDKFTGEIMVHPSELNKCKMYLYKDYLNSKDFIKDEYIPENNTQEPWWSYLKKYKLNRYPIGYDRKEVEVNTEGDVNSHWVLRWVDKKTGQPVRVYTKEFLNKNAEHKWNRIKLITTDVIKRIKSNCARILKSNTVSDKVKQAAAIVDIIVNTGLRPGDRKYYNMTANRGVSTLSPDNIKISGDNISFNFTGKSYQENTASFNNGLLASYLLKRKNEYRGKEFIFDVQMDYLDEIFKRDIAQDDKLKIKDLRTYIAADIAGKLLREEKPPMPLPSDKKKLRKVLSSILNNVFQKVSKLLNNSPTMAKNSYVPPFVIDAWLASLGLTKADVMVSEHSEYLNVNGEEKKELQSLLDMEDDEDLDILFNLPDWYDYSVNITS